MGLLDALQSDQGLFGLSLLAAAAPRAGGRTSLGEGLLGASQAVAQRRQQAQEQAMRQQMQQLQVQEMQARAQERQAALAQAQQQAAQQAAIEDAYRKALRTPQQSAMAQNGGPTVAAAQASESMGPSFDQKALIANLIGPAPKLAAEMLQPKPVDYKVVGDSLLQIGQSGVKEAYRAPDKPEKTPETLRTLEMIYGKGSPEFQAAAQRLAGKMTTHAPAASITNYGAPVPVELADGSTGYVQPTNRGGPVAPMSSPDGRPLVKPTEEKPLTEGQAKAVVYASRMLASDKVLASLARKGAEVSVPGSRAGFGVGDAINAFSPAEQQMLDQAKRDFINATLRRESGAVIADSEFQNADKQYFPQVGDSREVREQKARNRRIAIEGVRADVPKAKQSEVDRIAGGNGPTNPAAFDPEKERRYQEWKRKQGQQ